MTNEHRLEAAETHTELPRLPRDGDGPVFAEPWQAQAFALAVTLSGQGHFTWKEWAAALADELKAAADRGEPDDGSRYYEYWLVALERLVATKGLVDSSALRLRKEAWAVAYRATPHGTPIELRRSRPDMRWLFGGLVCALAGYWLIQRTSGVPAGEGASWAAWVGLDRPPVFPELGLVAGGGFGTLLGMRHALEPDHLAAVSTLLTGERTSARAAWLGTWWGLGHTMTLLIAGATLVLLQSEMPRVASDVFELGVVLLLLAFGVRAIHLSALQGAPARPHTHARPGRSKGARWTSGRRPFLVGAVHGLAGSGTLTAFVTTMLPSIAAQLSYLLLFGVGSTMGMAVLSGVIGWNIARLGHHRSIVRGLSLAIGSLSTALGLSWAVSLLDRVF
jgi:nitrile hydratase accessory protein